MTTYNTGNPIGSKDPRDLYDNAENLDEAVNTRQAESWDDRFGVARKTWWGMEQDFQQFLINSGYENIGDYGPGLEITARNQIFWRDGELYRAGASLALPYTTTGDWGDEEGLFVAVGDAGLRQQLADSNDPDNGAGMIAVKMPGTTTVARTQYDINKDLVNVKDYGAVGDWDASTKTGTDDTEAFQNAINALSKTYRAGGVHIIRIPAGNYKITSITIPASLSFGVIFSGEGLYSSIIWSDPTNLDPTIDSEIESVRFDGLGLFGALDNAGSSTERKKVFYRGKQASKRPDVDVTFTNCQLGFSDTFIEAYGRGVIVDQTCLIVYCAVFLNIVCDPDTTFSGGTNNAMQTGMRNYYISPSRVDVVSRIIKITGDGDQRDFINDINMNGSDLAAVDRLIEFEDATISRVCISGITAIDSFGYGALVGKRIDSLTLDLVAAKQYNRDFASPTGINGLITLTGSAQNVSIKGDIRDLRGHLIQVGANSYNINCNITSTGLASDGNPFVAIRGANCHGVDLNIAALATPPGTVLRFFSEDVQTNPNYRCRSSGADFIRPAVRFTPHLYAGSTMQTTTLAEGMVRVDTGIAYVDIACAYEAGSDGSFISIYLYGTVVGDFYPSSSMVGEVVIGNTNAMIPIRGQINLSQNRIELFKNDGTQLRQSDVTGVFAIKLSAKYPILFV